MPLSLTCPECNSTLRLSQAVTPGKKVKCPRCSEVFAAPTDDAQALRSGESKRRPTVAPDDDLDEAPRKLRRPRDDDDFDDPDDRPRRKVGARTARDFDDDDDFDDAPSRSRRPAKKSGKGLMIGLAVGGGVAVIAIIGVVLYLVLGGGGSATQKMLVGTWETNAPIRVRWTFTSDGKLVQDLGGMQLESKYRVINASTLEIDMPNPFADMAKDMGNAFAKVNIQGMPGMKIDFKMPDVGAMGRKQVTISINQNELTVHDRGQAVKFRRV